MERKGGEIMKLEIRNMKYALYILFLLLAVSVNAQTLDEYLVIAAENNPGLKARFSEYEAALQKVNQVGSLPDPKLDFGYFISPIETRNGPQQAKIGVMQMFPWLGTLSAKEEVMANMAKAKYELFEGAKKELYYQVKELWYELYDIDQSIVIVNENLVILQSFESLATQKFETGSKRGMVDVLRIQMEIAELENKLLLLKDMLLVKKIAFNNMLNRDVSLSVELPKEQAVLAIYETKKQLNDSIKNGNNSLKSMAMKQQAFQSSEVAAKKMGLPMIGVGLNYFMIGKSDMVVPNSGRDALMPMVSLSIPIYRKRYNAQIKEAQLNGQAVAQKIENKQNMLNTMLEMSWVKYDDAQRRIDLYNNQNIKAKQALEIIVNSYANSGKDFEEILRIQRMMLKYDLEIIKAIKDNNIAISKIESLK